jgi:hypothetical protein
LRNRGTAIPKLNRLRHTASREAKKNLGEIKSSRNNNK